jgi:hypothetical protein
VAYDQFRASFIFQLYDTQDVINPDPKLDQELNMSCIPLAKNILELLFIFSFNILFHSQSAIIYSPLSDVLIIRFNCIQVDGSIFSKFNMFIFQEI